MSEPALKPFGWGPFHPEPYDKLILLEARKSITEARKVLELRQPTLFLGERHYEPFPLQPQE